jgi:ABC-2 type transport system permease protein
MMRRLLAIWHARNLEFLRDRANLIFTLLLPISLVVGMGFVFGGPARPIFKVGVITSAAIDKSSHSFLQERYIDFVPIANAGIGAPKISHQQIDLPERIHC